MTKFEKRRLVLFVVCYLLDMTAAILGFTFGFGLHIVNWWAVLGFMIVSRFGIHLINKAMWAITAAEKEK